TTGAVSLRRTKKWFKTLVTPDNHPAGTNLRPAEQISMRRGEISPAKIGKNSLVSLARCTHACLRTSTAGDRFSRQKHPTSNSQLPTSNGERGRFRAGRS